MSSLLPARGRAHRSLLPQTTSLSSHPKETQLATPEPVVNSHQQHLKGNYPQSPSSIATYFCPLPHTPRVSYPSFLRDLGCTGVPTALPLVFGLGLVLVNNQVQGSLVYYFQAFPPIVPKSTKDEALLRNSE